MQFYVYDWLQNNNVVTSQWFPTLHNLVIATKPSRCRYPKCFYVQPSIAATIKMFHYIFKLSLKPYLISLTNFFNFGGLVTERQINCRNSIIFLQHCSNRFCSFVTDFITYNIFYTWSMNFINLQFKQIDVMVLFFSNIAAIFFAPSPPIWLSTIFVILDKWISLTLTT